jgi:hypothetical protein
MSEIEGWGRLPDDGRLDHALLRCCTVCGVWNSGRSGPVARSQGALYRRSGWSANRQVLARAPRSKSSDAAGLYASPARRGREANHATEEDGDFPALGVQPILVVPMRGAVGNPVPGRQALRLMRREALPDKGHGRVRLRCGV